MAKHPGVGRGSLVVLDREHTIGGGVVRCTRDYVMTGVMVRAMVIVVSTIVVVIIVIMLLSRLPLRVLLVLHPSVLEPDFDLPLR